MLSVKLVEKKGGCSVSLSEQTDSKEERHGVCPACGEGLLWAVNPLGGKGVSGGD